MRSGALNRRIAKPLGRALLFAFAITGSGCPFFLPTPGIQHRAPSTDVVHKIEPKVTSRADVLMMLGEPDFRFEEDRYFVYGWSETWAVVGVVVPAGYQAYPIGAGLGARNALALDFGPDARVARVKVFSKEMEGLQDVGKERVATERLLWDEIHAWMKTVDAPAPEGVK